MPYISMMTDTPIIELVTPKQNTEDLVGALDRFAQRYRAIVGLGFIISMPDNPMGVLRFRSLEVMEELDLPVAPEQILMHLNTFHSKSDLDKMLENSLSIGVKQLLIVTGDGGERLAKLAPEDLGCGCNTVTAVELLAYIHSSYPGRFDCGVAFNPYEPFTHEIAKLDRKLAAGASFAVTQPIIEKHKNVDSLTDLSIPVFVGAWMSGNLKALSDCVGYPVSPIRAYNALDNAAHLRRNYPGMGIYYCAVRSEIQLADIRKMSGNVEKDVVQGACHCIQGHQ